MSLGALIMGFGSLILGPCCQRMGSKSAIILGSFINLAASTSQVVYSSPEVLLMGMALRSLGSALFMISYGPFLTENSTPYERTHLFGASQSFSITASFAGSTLAGYLPGWLALTLLLPVDSAPTFQLALIAWLAPMALGILPLFLVKEELAPEASRPTAPPESLKGDAPPGPASSDRGLREPKGRRIVIVQFAVVSALIGLGAGFVVPWLNIFFWDFYDLPTPMVGLITGLGQASLAAGFLLAPALSTRIGKVRTVVICQTLSLPFLLILAIVVNPLVAVACFLMRGLLMNAAGPVDSTLRMELVPSSWRPNVSAVTGAAWNLAWSLSTQITGPLYDQGVYLLPFWFTLACYTGSTILYALFFHDAERRLAAELAAQMEEPPTALRSPSPATAAPEE